MADDLAVVIVTWNVRDLALEAVRSLSADLEAHGPMAQIVVVDSASTDGTADAVATAFPSVRVMACADNLGFGAANNLALRELGFGQNTASGAPGAVYLLNPDTITQPGATRALYNALMADARVGMVGARLTYGDGGFQHSAFQFPGLRQLWVEFFPTPGRLIESAFNGRYPRVLYHGTEPFTIDFPLGAAMMLKREVIEQIGVFDEQFFMYCEEIDLAWRIRQAGWRALCVPTAHVVHLGGQSTGQVRPESILNLWTSRLRLYNKHYPRWKALLARLLIALGVRLKARQASRSRQMTAAERGALVRAYRRLSRLALKE